MSIFQSFILGLIQGLGEFLPISSSGHLLGAGLFLKYPQDQAAKMFDILLHVGTLIPVAVIFAKDWFEMLRHPVRNKTLLLLFVASLPTLAIYLITKKLFPEVNGFAVFDSGWFLGVSFLISSLFLLIADRMSEKHTGNSEVRIVNAVVMGIFQGIGMIPGVTRSGSTITGGIATGLKKETAAKFSFLMSAPAILGSLIMEGKDAIAEGYYRDISVVPTIVGVLSAALFGFLAIRFMLKIISKVSLSWFSLYLAVIGVIYLVLQFAGVSPVPAFAPVLPAVG